MTDTEVGVNLTETEISQEEIDDLVISAYLLGIEDWSMSERSLRFIDKKRPELARRIRQKIARKNIVIKPDALDLNSATKNELMSYCGLIESEVDKIIQGRPYKNKTQTRKLITNESWDRVLFFRIKAKQS